MIRSLVVTPIAVLAAFAPQDNTSAIHISGAIGNTVESPDGSETLIRPLAQEWVQILVAPSMAAATTAKQTDSWGVFEVRQKPIDSGFRGVYLLIGPIDDPRDAAWLPVDEFDGPKFGGLRTNTVTIEIRASTASAAQALATGDDVGFRNWLLGRMRARAALEITGHTKQAERIGPQTAKRLKQIIKEFPKTQRERALKVLPEIEKQARRVLNSKEWAWPEAEPFLPKLEFDTKDVSRDWKRFSDLMTEGKRSEAIKILINEHGVCEMLLAVSADEMPESWLSRKLVKELEEADQRIVKDKSASWGWFERAALAETGRDGAVLVNPSPRGYELDRKASLTETATSVPRVRAGLLFGELAGVEGLPPQYRQRFSARSGGFQVAGAGFGR